jgi:hypothetical protein
LIGEFFMSEMVSLLRHDRTVFENQTVYITGNAYVACEFHRCTLVFTGFPFALEDCEFRGCIWHLNILLHDPRQTEEVIELLSEMVLQTVPRISDDAAEANDEEA